MFDTNTGVLTERKRKINKIYDGYVFQVYAQYFGLSEVGFEVKKIKIHDLTANKNYAIPLPADDNAMLAKFEGTVHGLNSFDLTDQGFEPNQEKCKQCIYSGLCDKASC